MPYLNEFHLKDFRQTSVSSESARLSFEEFKSKACKLQHSSPTAKNLKAMDYEPQKDYSSMTEPLQSGEPGPVVAAQYLLQKPEQFTLENAIFTKHWSITNANGQEIFRVRGKLFGWGRPKRELVDMDGNSIVIMKEKLWSWVGTWRAFETGNQDQPLWTIKKGTFCGFKVRLKIFLPSNTERQIPDYSIKGEWLCKKSTIFFGEQKVAEVVREASLKNILTRKSIFHVLVQPGVDTAFIFSLIVIMDKLYIHNCHHQGGAGGST